jgi:methyl-accepting chemotaxis protein
LNDKKRFFIALLAFIAGILLGLVIGTLGAGFRGSGKQSDSAELRERLEQVNRDLFRAIDSQREAAERASRLQTELQGITDYARKLEEGTRRAEARAGSVADQLDGIIEQSGELADGINRASGSLEESRILLDELGTLLYGLQGDSGREN